MIGAANAGQVRIAIARTSPCRSPPLSTTSRPTGTIKAPPTPCKTRQAHSSIKEFEAAQSPEATVKIRMAHMNTVREPSRSVIQPLNGITIARVTK